MNLWQFSILFFHLILRTTLENQGRVIYVCENDVAEFRCSKPFDDKEIDLVEFIKAPPNGNVLMRVDAAWSISLSTPRVCCRKNDTFGFCLTSTQHADEGMYYIDIHYIGVDIFPFCIIELKVLGKKDCPDSTYLKPKILLRRKESYLDQSMATGIWHLAARDNITLLVEIPSANPPVLCTVTNTNQTLQRCNGSTTRTKACQISLSFANKTEEIIIVNLTFIAYQPSIRVLTFHIEAPTIVESQTIPIYTGTNIDISPTFTLEAHYATSAIVALILVVLVVWATCYMVEQKKKSWPKGINSHETPLDHISEIDPTVDDNPSGYVEMETLLNRQDQVTGDLQSSNSKTESVPETILMSGHLEKIKLHYTCENVNTASKMGKMPLVSAVSFGYLDVVEYFLSIGANPNKAGADGLTPLHIAAKENYIDIVKSLLQSKASLTNLDRKGRTPLYGKLELARQLAVGKPLQNINSEEYCESEAFHLAAKKGEMDVIQYLIKEGIDIHMKDKHDRTALDIASEHYQPDIVNYLNLCLGKK